MTSAITAAPVAMVTADDSQRRSVKRKTEEVVVDERWRDMPHKICRAGPEAAQPRSYVTFPRADTVLKAESGTAIEDLHNVLVDEGLLEHLKVEFIHAPTPMVRFQHSKDELAGLADKHVELYPFFGNGSDYCFSKESEEDTQPSMMGLSESPTAKRKLVRDLIEQADRYFATTPARSPVKFTFKKEATDVENLTAAYQKFQGLCIGETHFDVAPKKFLVDNMQVLRDLGVRTLFMEDYMYDVQQTLLDHYFETPGAEPPHLLEAYQERWDELYEFEAPYTYMDILRKAKQCGIRIVGIDTSVSNEIDSSLAGNPDPMARMRGMNFAAKQIIDREKGSGKYLAFMGQCHAATMTEYHKDEPKRVVRSSTGIADILQCPLINIEDAVDDDRELTLVNTDRQDESEPFWHEKHIHLYLLRRREENL